MTRPRTILFAVFLMLGFALTGVLYATQYGVYIFKMWLILFVVTTILGAIMRCSRCSDAQMSHFESLLRMIAIILSMFFLFNGVGIASSAAITDTSGANITLATLSIQNNVSEIMGSIFYNPQMLICIVFAIFGMVLINIGDAQDSPDVYTIGTLALTVIPGILCIMTLVGWIAPGAPFDAFGALAPLAQFTAIVTIVMLIASVGFMFDDLIKSATAGE